MLYFLEKKPCSKNLFDFEGKYTSKKTRYGGEAWKKLGHFWDLSLFFKISEMDLEGGSWKLFFLKKKWRTTKNKVLRWGLEETWTLLRPEPFFKISEMDLEGGSWKLIFSNKNWRSTKIKAKWDLDDLRNLFYQINKMILGVFDISKAFGIICKYVFFGFH